jgi:arylsulfatase A-like enzyme
MMFIIGPAQSSSAASAKRPNIVILFADDLGWSDVSYQSGAIQTPHIDALAKAGTVFSAAYVPTATCSPSRAALLTGRHPARLRLTRHISLGGNLEAQLEKPFNDWEGDPTDRPSRNWLPLEHRTYAEVLANHGYLTGFVGKWHLGPKPFYPSEQGFDQTFGVTPAGHPNSYYPPYFRKSDTYADVSPEKYLTERLTDDAVRYIKDQPQDQPYHLSLFYYTVHSPLEGPKRLVEKFKQQGMSAERANYAAMLKALDRSVGRIHKAIQSRGDADETLILFAGDQGGRFENAPFRGRKMVDQTYEGGSRVPFFVTWPDEIPAGRTITKPIMTTDVMPTLANLVGADREALKPLDGISLRRVLLQGAPVPDRSIFLFRSYNATDQALRDGRWKLIADLEGESRLYDLHNDPREQHDLADDRPAQTRALETQLEAWKALMGVSSTSKPNEAEASRRSP